MSIFSVFSRGDGSQPQEQQQQQQQQQSAADTTLMSDQQVAQSSGSHYGTSDQRSRTESAINQLQGGVSEFLSQVDLSSTELNSVVRPSGIEYLNLEEGPAYANGVMPSRGWSDDLCYGTGTLYIAGLSTGGLWGFIEGMKNQNGTNFKLRLNSVLNSMTRRGPFVGNSLAVIALFYNSINSMVGSYRGTKDTAGSIGAAAASGMLFKIASGPRASLISGAVCAGAVGAYQLSLYAYATMQEKKQNKILASPSEPKLSQTA